MLEGVTTAAVTTILNTEVLVRPAGGSGTEGLTALKGQVGLAILEGTVKETNASATKNIFVAALVDAFRGVDDSRST